MIYNAIAQMIPFELEIGEILVNGPTMDPNTVEHTDYPCDNGISWIYYVNREWKEEWGGETIIKLDGEWKKVYPFDVFSYSKVKFHITDYHQTIHTKDYVQHLYTKQ